MIRSLLTLGLLGTGGVLLAMATPLGSVTLGDGTVAFNRPPLLLGASASHITIRFPVSTYSFEFDIRPDAGEPLGQVRISQDSGPEQIALVPEATTAYLAGRPRQGVPVTATYDPQTGDLVATFNPPIPPGNRLTLALEPRQNPSTAATYLFGVTVYPAGTRSLGQFIGYGRLLFYGDFGDH